MSGWRSGLAIGLMSGTSADGIDAALVGLRERPGRMPSARLVRFLYRPHPRELRRRLLALCLPEALVTAAAEMHAELGRRFGAAARALMRAAQVAPGDVAVIGSHGHTIAHYPGGRSGTGRDAFTVQIGDPARIAEACGVPVVSDFRAHDVALGGEGAPLVPYFDHATFASPHETRVLLNIGGIANVTVLASGAALSRVTAFDTGPGNMVLDAAARDLSGGRLALDRGGAWAARGRVDDALLRRWLCDAYFARGAPKTTGREAFGAAYTERRLAEAAGRGLDSADAMATLTAVVADSIADAVRGAAPGPVALIASGGGLHNRTLMARIAAALPLVRPWQSTEAYGVPPDAKEAMAFAYLAWEHLRGRSTGVPSVTGARAGGPLGAFTPARGRPYTIITGSSPSGPGRQRC